MAGARPGSNLCSSRNLDIQTQSVRGYKLQTVFLPGPLGKHIVTRWNRVFRFFGLEILAVHGLDARVVGQAVRAIYNFVPRLGEQVFRIRYGLWINCTRRTKQYCGSQEDAHEYFAY